MRLQVARKATQGESLKTPARLNPLLLEIVHGRLTFADDIGEVAARVGIEVQPRTDEWRLIRNTYFFDRTHANSARAARILLLNKASLAHGDMVAVFNHIVTDAAAFLIWCFPILGLLWYRVKGGATVGLREWLGSGILRDPVVRPLVLHLLITYTTREWVVDKGDFDSQNQNSPLIKLLRKHGLLEAWQAYLSSIPGKEVLRQSFLGLFENQKLSNEAAAFPMWMIAPPGKEGIKRQQYILRLTVVEVNYLWSLFSSDRVFNPRTHELRAFPVSNKNSVYRTLLADMERQGYLIPIHVQDRVYRVDVERFSRTSFFLLREGRTEVTTRFEDLTTRPEARCLGTPWMIRLQQIVGMGKDVVVAGREYKRQPDSAPSAITRIPVSWQRSVKRDIFLTPSEAKGLLWVSQTQKDVLAAEKVQQQLGSRLYEHLIEASYLTPLAGTPNSVSVNNERFAETVFGILDPDDLLHARLHERNRGEVVSMMWGQRLERTIHKAGSRHEHTHGVERSIQIRHSMRVSLRCAEQILCLAALTPFSFGDLRQVLGEDLRRFLQDSGYISDNGCYYFKFIRTRWEVVARGGGEDDLLVYQEVTDGETVPEMAWYSALRAHVPVVESVLSPKG